MLYVLCVCVYCVCAVCVCCVCVCIGPRWAGHRAGAAQLHGELRRQVGQGHPPGLPADDRDRLHDADVAGGDQVVGLAVGESSFILMTPLFIPIETPIKGTGGAIK